MGCSQMQYSDYPERALPYQHWEPRVSKHGEHGNRQTRVSEKGSIAVLFPSDTET